MLIDSKPQILHQLVKNGNVDVFGLTHVIKDFFVGRVTESDELLGDLIGHFEDGFLYYKRFGGSDAACLLTAYKLLVQEVRHAGEWREGWESG